MNKVLLSLIFVLTLSQLIAAQNQTDDGKVEIFGGYSRTGHLTVRENDNLESIENGFSVAATYKVHRYVGIKVAAAATYNKLEGYYISNSTGLAITPSTLWQSTSSLKTVEAGIQFKNYEKNTLLKPFGHLLVGYGKRSGDFPTTCPAGTICPPKYPYFIEAKGVSAVFGGGLDIRLNRRFDARLFQFDVNPIFDKNETYLNFRVATGIIFKF